MKLFDRKLLTVECTFMCLISVMFQTVSIKADTVFPPIARVTMADSHQSLVETQTVEVSITENIMQTDTQSVEISELFRFPAIPVVQTADPIFKVSEKQTVKKKEKSEKEYLYSEGYVRVRKKNTKKSSEKFLLKPGQKVEVLKEIKKTVKVKSGKKVGYVVKKNLLAETKKEAVKESKKKAENFRITGYCSCYKCSGGWGTKTKSGKKAKAKHTVAADLSVFSLNTEVYIEGIGKRTVEDVGGAVNGKHIDVYVDKHHQSYEVTASNVKVFEVEG